MTDKIDNMEIWYSVCETDPGTTKEVGFGRKFTAIDAYSQIKRATELWGPYGVVWGLTTINHTHVEGTTMMLVNGVFNYPNGGFPVSSSIFYVSEKGKPDDNFAKKVETDLITKALSRLGFNADVFMGKFDDNRYVQDMKRKFSQIDPAPINIEKVEKAVAWVKKVIDKDDLEKGAPLIQEKWKLLTNDEKMKAGDMLKDKAPNSGPRGKMYGTLLAEYLQYVPEV